jgi:hypothetical protein
LKKTNWIIALVLAIVFVFLFYKQSLGYNVLLFSGLYILADAILNKSKSKLIWLFRSGVLAMAVFYILNASTSSIWMLFVSWALLYAAHAIQHSKNVALLLTHWPFVWTKSEIYAYLDILNYYYSPLNAKLITDKIAKSKAQSWIKTEALYVRIFNGLKVKKKIKNKLLNELDSRFATILVYDRMGKLNEVPKAYITNEALAKLVIRNYFIEDGEAPSVINILGTIDHNGKIVYVTSCAYGEAWDKYIGLVGDFGTNGVDIKSIKAYTDWNIVEEDWKAQALKLLADFDEFAF